MIREEAMTIAQSYHPVPVDERKGPKPTVKELYVEAAKELSLPYWDWASVHTADFGLPTIVTSPTCKVSCAHTFAPHEDCVFH